MDVTQEQIDNAETALSDAPDKPSFGRTILRIGDCDVADDCLNIDMSGYTEVAFHAHEGGERSTVLIDGSNVSAIITALHNWYYVKYLASPQQTTEQTGLGDK